MDKEFEQAKLKEYEEFVKTDEGKKWKDHWIKEISSDDGGSFGDYL